MYIKSRGVVRPYTVYDKQEKLSIRTVNTKSICCFGFSRTMYHARRKFEFEDKATPSGHGCRSPLSVWSRRGLDCLRI